MITFWSSCWSTVNVIIHNAAETAYSRFIRRAHHMQAGTRDGKRCWSSVLFRFGSHILCFNFGSVLCEFGGLTVLIILQWLLRHLTQFLLQKKRYIWVSKKTSHSTAESALVTGDWPNMQWTGFRPTAEDEADQGTHGWRSTYGEDLKNMNLSWDSA